MNIAIEAFCILKGSTAISDFKIYYPIKEERERSKQMTAVDCGEIYEILLGAYWLV